MLNSLSLNQRRSFPVLPVTWPIILGAAVLAGGLILLAPMTGDWRVTFYPAGQYWLSPYDNSRHFVYPPWLALILAPFALFSVTIARALFATVSVTILGYAVRALGGGLTAFLLALFSPVVLTILVRGEMDALPVLGLIFVLGEKYSSQFLGLILLALKPQTLAGAAVVAWLHSTHKWRLMAAFALFLLASLLVYGWWPGDILIRLPQLYRVDSLNLWPFGIPVGLALLFMAVKKENILLGALATLFLTPYINWYSLTGYTVILFSRLPRPVSILLFGLSWLALQRYATG